MSRRIFLSILMLALALVFGTGGAVAAQSPSPAMSAESFMKDVVDDILSVVEKRREELQEDPQALRDLVTEQIMPHVDFRYLSQLVLARHWRTASEAQREAFMGAFRNMLMRTYADALLAYRDQKIRYLPNRNDPERRDAQVRTEIVPKDGQPIPVTYRLYRNDQGEWKIYDITVERISLVTNYRSTFDDQIRKRGLDGLIEQLENHNIKAIDVADQD